MNETKLKIRFFTIADYIEEEIWLRKMHNEGWKLVKMVPPCFYKFEKCEPEDVIYRLDFKDNTENPDYMKIMISDGNIRVSVLDGCISERVRLQLKMRMKEKSFLIMNRE